MHSKSLPIYFHEILIQPSSLLNSFPRVTLILFTHEKKRRGKNRTANTQWQNKHHHLPFPHDICDQFTNNPAPEQTHQPLMPLYQHLLPVPFPLKAPQPASLWAVSQDIKTWQLTAAEILEETSSHEGKNRVFGTRRHWEDGLASSIDQEQFSA